MRNDDVALPPMARPDTAAITMRGIADIASSAPWIAAVIGPASSAPPNSEMSALAAKIFSPPVITTDPGGEAHSSIAISGVVLGPSLTPIGLAMRDMKSTWAPSSWRVRSPIHRKCPDSAYARPLTTRVSARSYSSASASCEQ